MEFVTSAWRSFRIASNWVVTATPEEVAEILSEPLAITRWWSSVFMDGELIEHGDELGKGCTVRLYTKGLLPHTFQFIARIIDSDAKSSIIVETCGDFNGRGEITLTPHGRKLHVHVLWTVDVKQPYIRPLLGLFKPIFIANHRWAMRRGRIGLTEEIRRRRFVRSGRRVPAPRQAPTFPHNLAFIKNRFRWNSKVAAWKD